MSHLGASWLTRPERDTEENTRETGVTNIETVLAEATDPKLPAGTCDLVLLVDVYHELSDPAAVLGHLSRALAPEGRIALLEFRAEDPEVPIKELHKMSKRQILAEYGANGLVLQSEFDGLPWQHLMFFRRDDRDEHGFQGPTASEIKCVE